MPPLTDAERTSRARPDADQVGLILDYVYDRTGTLTHFVLANVYRRKLEADVLPDALPAVALDALERAVGFSVRG